MWPFIWEMTPGNISEGVSQGVKGAIMNVLSKQGPIAALQAPGRSIQTQERASAKSLGQEHAGGVHRTKGRLGV